MPDKPTLLISGGRTTMPLWKPLAEMFELMFLHPQAAQLASDSGLAVHHLGEYINPDIQEKVESDAALKIACVVGALPSLRAAASLCYGGLDLPDEMGSSLDNWLPGYVHSSLRTQMLTLAALSAASRPENRRVVGMLTHEDVSQDFRAAVLFARAHGIPVVHMPHAACHMLPDAGPDIHRETRSDWISASGTYMRDWYAEQGFPPGRIEIVGVPEWDHLYTDALPSKAQARSVLRIDGGEKVILYGTTWGQTTSMRSRFDAEFDETLAAVFDLARTLKAVTIINMHPNEARANADRYAQAMHTAQIPGLVTPVHGLYCTRAADLVIKHGPSNFCVEAAIMGVPSIYVQTEGFDYRTPLPPRGKVSELASLAKEALSVPRETWDGFIKVYNDAHGSADATECAVKMIGRVCSP